MTDFKVIFSGREVVIDDIVFVVHPISMNQFGAFSEKIVGLIQHITSIKAPEGITEEQMYALYFKTALPYVLSHMLNVVYSCVTVDDKPLSERDDTQYIPHHYFPQIASAWLEESFADEGKVRVWVQALKDLMMYAQKEDNPVYQALSSFSAKTESD